MDLIKKEKNEEKTMAELKMRKQRTKQMLKDGRLIKGVKENYYESMNPGVGIVIDAYDLATKQPSCIMHCVFAVRKKPFIDIQSEILMEFKHQKKPFDKVSVQKLFEETDCIITFHKLTGFQHSDEVRSEFRQKCEHVLSKHDIETKFLGFFDPRTFSII